MAWTVFGPGTVTLTVGATPSSFEQEVKGGGVEHEYEDIGESVTYLDSSVSPAGKSRTDRVTLECDFDLGSAGFYTFLYTNDLAEAEISFVPNTAATAEWSGTVVLQLPDGATADEFGAKLSGTVELSFVGACLFTPGA
jgi:hypothetical protein